MVDRCAALDTSRLGEPPIAFPVGALVEDVVRAIAARAELLVTVVRAGSQRVAEPLELHPEWSVGEAFDIIRGLFGREVYIDPRGQFVWIGLG